MHHYFSICPLSFTSNFLNQLQYVMMIFSRMFDCLYNLINRTSSAPISLDIRRVTL